MIAQQDILLERAAVAKLVHIPLNPGTTNATDGAFPDQASIVWGLPSILDSQFLVTQSLRPPRASFSST